MTDKKNEEKTPSSSLETRLPKMRKKLLGGDAEEALVLAIAKAEDVANQDSESPDRALVSAGHKVLSECLQALATEYDTLSKTVQGLTQEFTSVKQHVSTLEKHIRKLNVEKKTKKRYKAVPFTDLNKSEKKCKKSKSGKGVACNGITCTKCNPQRSILKG